MESCCEALVEENEASIDHRRDIVEEGDAGHPVFFCPGIL